MAALGVSPLPSSEVDHEAFYNLLLNYEELQGTLAAMREELMSMKSKKNFYKDEAIKWRAKSKWWKQEAEHQENMRTSCWYRMKYRVKWYLYSG